MKTFLQILLFFLLVTQICFGQSYQQSNESRKNIMQTHDLNLKSIPEKSFYKQKTDWQYIIDTTWGPGLPLDQKRHIFNTFTAALNNNFDGFQSLGLTIESWDSLKSYYFNKIDSSTSRGKFCAIMQSLCSKLRDCHTYCDDIEVYNTLLNPGVPFFVTSGIPNVSHFGAVTTVLSDSTVLILRVADNHPLNLKPGDIILGYEGVPWKQIVSELIDAELPNSDWWGGYIGTYTDHLLVGAGMNWHLFNTIDILKYETGDTAHLSLAPLVNYLAPDMLNNEQLSIPNIPFPDYFSGEVVTYGLLENTNIGYIYMLSDDPQLQANAQFEAAALALGNTDALIIDLRWNEGGSAHLYNAFNYWANETFYTIESVNRCNSSNFNLCVYGDKETFKITGNPATRYENPIAILLGPNCKSDGEMNAYRFKYLFNVKTFGKPTWGSLGAPSDISSAGWYMSYSFLDKYNINNPNVYLNRKEYPIDFPVWHNRNDVAAGKDAIVEKALEWINNLVYPHNVRLDKNYYPLAGDTLNIFTSVENPNTDQLSARGYIYNLSNVLIDSVDLLQQTFSTKGENWDGSLSSPQIEDFFKVSVKVFDQTTSEEFTLPNAARFTTVPLIIDSLECDSISNFKYSIKPFIKNAGTDKSITNITLRLLCSDAWATAIFPEIRTCPNLLPGQTVGITQPFAITYDPATFPGYFNLKFEIMSNSWTYWTYTLIFYVPNWNGIEDELNPLPKEFTLEQNYPNPLNPSTTIKYSIPTSSQVTLKIFNTLGQEIETLVNEEKPLGTYELNWNAANLPSGVYFYQLKAGPFVETKKMIILK